MNKFSMTRLGLFIVIFSGVFVMGFSQTNSMGKVNIASPNAASLGKYGDIPISYHTGVPNISIPLYTIKSSSLQMPVSLSYHASGLKVEEQDSWVGAGWTLNAGGAITRTVKGKPDEKQTNSLSQTYGYFSDYGLGSIYPQDGTQLSEGTFDSEPDLFFFNFNGYSGKFYFNDDRTPMLVPEQDIKIEYSYTSGLWNGSPGPWVGFGRCIESFIITIPDGTKYYFGMNNATSPYCDPIEVSSTFTSQGGTSFSQVISSWYLNKIVSADGNSTINLSYQRDKYAFYTFGNSPIFSAGSLSNKYELTKNLLAGVRLSTIAGANERIDFTPGAARQDVSSWNVPVLDESITDNPNTTSPVLGDLKIYDISGNCFKKYNFYYNYFIDSTTTIHPNFLSTKTDMKRLRLDSLKEQACDGAIILPPYKFDYFTEKVNRKLSFSRDHWGYNNGASTNTQLYPLLKMSNSVINSIVGSDIANRSSKWPEMRAGALNKITYPTGGNTAFDFEPNTFTVNTPTGTADSLVGGLRIKTISNYIPESNQTVNKNYSYTSSTTGKSSGVLFGRPVYIQVFRNEMMKKTNFLGNPNSNGCWTYNDAAVVTQRQYVYSDNPIRPMESTQGYHIGYGEVKVSETGNGYNIYRYNVTPLYPNQINRDGVATTSIINPCTCSLDTLPNYPPAPLPTNFYRGELNYEANFSESGTLLRDKQYGISFEENLITTPGRTTFTFSAGGINSFTLETFYELKTAHKIMSNILETVYPSVGAPLTKTTQISYASKYHHQPTSIISIDSKGKNNEEKIKYAFDYRVPNFENISDCFTGAASFIDYMNSVFFAGNYQTIFNSCSSGYTSGPCFDNTMIKFDTTIWNARKRYVDCRKLNFTNITPPSIFQVNHDTAKARANSDLKPILWMQDIYMNSPIENSKWKDGKLLSASYVKYNNLRNDAVGVYPIKTYQIDLVASSSNFSEATVGSDNISIVKDSRYRDAAVFDFDRGNLISVINRDSIRSSYEWKYNEKLPVVKIVNAANQYKEAVLPGAVTTTRSFQLGSSSTSGNLNTTFYHTQTGDITISIPSGLPSGAKVTCYFSLSGPATINGSLCAAGYGAASCNGTPNSITYSNMVPGLYTFSPAVSTSFPSYTFNYSISWLYQGLVLSSGGLKEFYYESFEENSSATVGFSHSGNRYWPTSTGVGFTKPNARNYTVQWWNYAGGKWNFNQQDYTNGMTVTGPVDDIRVFPTDAQISTYAYNPLIGMTSQTDPNGKTTYYDYDKLGRLKNIRDNNRNITKNFFYNYGLAPKSLPALISFSANNTAAVQFDVQLTSKTSGQVFTYVANAATNTTLGSVPPDIYDVYISRKSGTVSYLYGLCTFSASGANTTFYNVQVAAGSCSSISIN